MNRQMQQQRVISSPQGDIPYLLTRKRVKNINLRIDGQGQVKVSAPYRVPAAYLDAFVQSKAGFIRKARERMAKREGERPTNVTGKQEKEEAAKILLPLCREIYPIVEAYGIAYPVITLRRMTSRWGSCQPTKGRITLNTRLTEVPQSAAEYVVLHEFAHFIHPNHSRQFYGFIETYMPDWKERKKGLERINL
jgi:hypothetical protein